MPSRKAASAGRTNRTATPKSGKAGKARGKTKGSKSSPRAKRATKAKPRAPAWQRPFLAALQATRSVSKACETVGVGRSTVYDRREVDEGFRQAWDAARFSWRDDLEASVLTWAIEGVPEPVFARVEDRDEDGVIKQTRTEVVGVKMRRNAAVSLRMLECLYPEKYGRDQGGDSDPHEAARHIREDLAAMLGSVPTVPPAGQSATLVEPAEPGLEPQPPGRAAELDAQGHLEPAPVTRKAKPHEPEPPP